MCVGGWLEGKSGDGTADSYLHHTFVPTSNNLSNPDREFKGLTSVHRRVELRPVLRKLQLCEWRETSVVAACKGHTASVPV